MNKFITKSKLKYYLVGIFLLSILSLNRLLAVDSIDLSSTDVNENIATWTTVATITSSGASWSVAYTFCSTWADNDSFSLSGDILLSSGAIDFETQASYSICLTATDDVWPIDTPFTINVTDLNEDPTDIALSGSTVDENSATWTTVWTFSTTDQDTGDTFTYTLVTWTWSDDNSSFTISWSTLSSNAIFDFETKSSYSVRVRSTDSWSLFTEKQFSVTITDLNDAPTALTLSWSSIDENLVIGTTIWTLTWTDDWENNDTLTYSFATTCASWWVDNWSFSINGSTLRSNEAFDFEAQSSYNVCVRVSDWDLFFDEEFLITINDISVEPSDIVLSSNIIDENLAIGTTIWTLTWTNDWTSTWTLVFSLNCASGWTDDSNFSITWTTLLSNAIFDFETKSTHNICIRVSDWVTNFDKQFPIIINNVNEWPIDLTLSANTIDENLPIWTTIWTLSWTNDSSSTWTLVYSLTCATGWVDDASFSLSWTNLLSNAVFDYETKSTYNICARLSDGTFNLDKNFVITINNISEWSSGWGWRSWGWWPWLVKDNCPSWDFSASYYDKDCGKSKPTTTWTWGGTSGGWTWTWGGTSEGGTSGGWTPYYFLDISDSFARTYIQRLASAWIVNWYPGGNFRPENNATRSEFLKIVLKAVGEDYSNADTTTLVFSDIDSNSWQAKVVAHATLLWIISTSNTNFRPNDNITRAEAIKILLNAANIDTPEVTSSSFSDVSWWAVKYIERAKILWIISDNTNFRPNDNITRAEVCKIVVITMDNLEESLF